MRFRFVRIAAILSDACPFQNAHGNTLQAPISHFNDKDGTFKAVQAQYGADRAVISVVLPVRISSAQLKTIWALPDK